MHRKLQNYMDTLLNGRPPLWVPEPGHLYEIDRPLTVGYADGTLIPVDLDFRGARIRQLRDGVPIVWFQGDNLHSWKLRNVTLEYARLQEAPGAVALLFDAGEATASGFYDGLVENVRLLRAHRGISTGEGVPVWSTEWRNVKILGCSGAGVHLGAGIGMPANTFTGNLDVRQYVQARPHRPEKVQVRNVEPQVVFSGQGFYVQSLTLEGGWNRMIYTDSSSGFFGRISFEWARRTNPESLLAFYNEAVAIGSLVGSDLRIVEAGGPIIKRPVTGGAVVEAGYRGSVTVMAATLYEIPDLPIAKGPVAIQSYSPRPWPPSLPPWARVYDTGEAIDEAYERRLKRAARDQ